MNTVILTGSHRKTSQSRRIGDLLADLLPQHVPGAEAHVIDLAHAGLPFWDEEFPNTPAWQERWGPISAKMVAMDALVVVCPEWNGMAPPMLKNVFLMAGHKELAHKPALLVSVSAGRGGAYPVAELRMSGYKNPRLCWIPEHLIVRDVANVTFDGDMDANSTFTKARAEYALRVLGQYAAALKAVRDSGVIDTETFANGM